jgi:lysophospholipase L1-like esterase
MGNFQELPAASTPPGRIRRWTNRYRRWLTIALILLAALAVAARAGMGLSQTTPLKGRIQPNSGHSFVAVMEGPKVLGSLFFSLRGDSSERPTGSTLRLFEDDKPLLHPHSQHGTIADKGGGQYSHWGPEGLHVYFSALDNSNPMTNGRTYSAQYRLHMRGPVVVGILLAVAVSLIWLYLPELKRFRRRKPAEMRVPAPALAPVGEPQKMHPVKTAVFSLITLVILSIMGIGLTVVTDMAWRAIYSPASTGLGTDMSFFEYRDYVVTTQPADLVLGKTKHPAEAYYFDRNCATPDGTTARFNSLGFRSPEFIGLPPKQPNEIRIIVTGGSASISHNVSEACTLDNNLQRLLTQRFPDKVVKVFNLGSGAWKSFQELIAIQRYETDIKPDLIIVFDGFNDITHSFNSDVRAPYAGWRMREAYVRFRDWVSGGPLTSFQGLRIVHDIPILLDKLSFDVIGRAGAASPLPEFATGGSLATRFELPVDRQRIAQRTDFDPANRRAVDQYLRNMKLMELAADNSGIRMLHVLQPMLYLKEPLSEFERQRLKVYEEMINYSIQGYERMSSGLQAMTAGSKFARYLDLSAPFQGDPKTYFFDYCHMNAEGYRIVSARVADDAAEMLQAQPK